MKKGLIGKKLGMTQIYGESGDSTPVTVIEVGPCPVIALRTMDKHGYAAVQLGFSTRKAKNVSKGVKGHLKAAGLDENPPAVIREIRWNPAPECAVGDTLGADLFSIGDFVDITGQSKGRGFQGVVKRWNFGGGRASHGGGWTRKPGSIGMCVSPGKVYKGRKMPGHMGNVRRTVQSLQIVEVRTDDQLLFVRGGIPGPNGGIVLVRSAIKK